jgi:hypothetical protein
VQSARRCRIPLKSKPTIEKPKYHLGPKPNIQMTTKKRREEERLSFFREMKLTGKISDAKSPKLMNQKEDKK